MSTQIMLSARLDTMAAAPLASSLVDALRDHASVEVAGGEVEMVGLACLQVLAGARVAADAAGRELRICYPSGPLIEGCVLAGLEELVRPA